MLNRARRIRSEEDLILPLFKPLAGNLEDGDFQASLFSVLTALAVASNDTIWEKLTFITNLFDINNSKVRDASCQPFLGFINIFYMCSFFTDLR